MVFIRLLTVEIDGKRLQVFFTFTHDGTQQPIICAISKQKDSAIKLKINTKDREHLLSMSTFTCACLLIANKMRAQPR